MKPLTKRDSVTLLALVVIVSLLLGCMRSTAIPTPSVTAPTLNNVTSPPPTTSVTNPPPTSIISLPPTTSTSTPTPTLPWKINGYNAIDIASRYVPHDIAQSAVISPEWGPQQDRNANVGHTSFWEVYFTNISITKDQLGWQTDNLTTLGPENSYNSLIVYVDGVTGEMFLRKAVTFTVYIRWEHGGVQRLPGDTGYLVDSKGMTLYFTYQDRDYKSSISGESLKTWPVFYAPNIVIAPAGGVMPYQNFGTITREDGAKQTTWGTQPLYYYAGDKVPGDMLGLNVTGRDVWDVITVGPPTGGPPSTGPQLNEISSPSSLRPTFSWNPVPNATEYEFILATDSALTHTIAGTPVKVTTTAISLSADLQPNTTYFWAVRVTAPTRDVQAIGVFTTSTN